MKPDIDAPEPMWEPFGDESKKPRPACPSCSAALAAKEKAEGALCSIKETIKRNVVDAPDLHAGNMNEAYLASLELQRRKEALVEAYRNSSPCPHEEEAKRLREAVEWACTEMEHESKADVLLSLNEGCRKLQEGIGNIIRERLANFAADLRRRSRKEG